MFRIRDPRLQGKIARLDQNENPVKIVADAFRIVMFCYDENPQPHVTVTLQPTHPVTREGIGPLTQLRFEKADLRALMTPDPSQPDRRKGDFRIRDLEQMVVERTSLDTEIDPILPNHFEDIVDALPTTPPPAPSDVIVNTLPAIIKTAGRDFRVFPVIP